MVEKKLTKRQEKFVEAMVDPETKTQTEAAIKAGHSLKNARSVASENLTKPNIVAAIEKRKAEMAEHANIYAELVFGGTALRATASIDDCLDANGRFDIKKARRTGVIHQIKRIVRTPNKYGEAVAVELYGKDAAQDKLGSYLGLEQLPSRNKSDLELIVTGYRKWQQDFPNATAEDRDKWIDWLCEASGADPKELRKQIQVQEVTTMLQ